MLISENPAFFLVFAFTFLGFSIVRDKLLSFGLRCGRLLLLKAVEQFAEIFLLTQLAVRLRCRAASHSNGVVEQVLLYHEQTLVKRIIMSNWCSNYRLGWVSQIDRNIIALEYSARYVSSFR